LLPPDCATEGTLAADKEGTISFTPPADGLYAMSLGAGGSAYSIVSADAPLAIYAKEGMSVIYGAGRLYFHVPEGLDKFSLRAKTGGAETIKLTIYDPQGKEVASGETTPTKSEVEVTAPVGDQGGKTWSVSLSKAAEGVLEDASLRLDPKLPPTVSLTPEQVLRVK
jgi:hypothetical protein